MLTVYLETQEISTIEKKNNAVSTPKLVLYLWSELHFRSMLEKLKKKSKEKSPLLEILIPWVWNLGSYIFNKEPGGI